METHAPGGLRANSDVAVCIGGGGVDYHSLRGVLCFVTRIHLVQSPGWPQRGRRGEWVDLVITRWEGTVRYFFGTALTIQVLISKP